MAKGKEHETKLRYMTALMLDIDRTLKQLLDMKTVRSHRRRSAYVREFPRPRGGGRRDGEEVVTKVRAKIRLVIDTACRRRRERGRGELKTIAPDLPDPDHRLRVRPSHIAIRARREGVVEVLYKPFDLRKLKEAISRALSEKRV
jgi:hypothetical protein